MDAFSFCTHCKRDKLSPFLCKLLCLYKYYNKDFIYQFLFNSSPNIIGNHVKYVLYQHLPIDNP